MTLSYAAEVLADAPVAYWRLNELALPTMFDSSGNGHDASYEAVVIFGQASPIQTDPASFAVAKSTAAYISAVSHPLGGQLDLADNFTWEAWGYKSGEVFLILKNGGVSLPSSTIKFDNTIQAGLYDDVTTLSIAASGFPDGFWYHVVATRNGDVFSLYVNGVLVGTDSGIGTGTISGSNYNSQPWKIGPSTSSSIIDEVALYDYPLSAARILIHYEAAILQTLLAGRSDIIPTAVLYSDVPPTPISFPFRHNWDQPLVERLSWRTTIARARDGLEEACATRRAPRRELEFTQILKSNTERRRFRHLLNANQHIPWWVPVRRDGELLSAPLTAGTVTIPVTTNLRDYVVGGYVQLRQLDDTGEISHWEEALVEGLVGGVQATIVNDYLVGSLIQPVRKAMIDTSLGIKGHTAEVEETQITARLLSEDELDQPPSIAVWHPTIKYRDYEVFDPATWQSSNWDDQAEYEVTRALDEIDFETGVFGNDSDTDAAEETFTYRILLEGRDSIAALLGWFYERAGSLNYLWVASQQRDWEPLNARGNDLQVVDTLWSDNFAGLEHRRDLAFVYNDNTMGLRRILQARGQVNEILELDAPVPSLTNLRSVSQLKFCRLDADALELAWHTDDKVVVSFRFHELLRSPEGVGPTSLSPSASLSSSQSPSLSASPSHSPSPSTSPSHSQSPSASASPSASTSPSSSSSPSRSPSASTSPSSSASPSV